MANRSTIRGGGEGLSSWWRWVNVLWSNANYVILRRLRKCSLALRYLWRKNIISVICRLSSFPCKFVCTVFFLVDFGAWRACVILLILRISGAVFLMPVLVGDEIHFLHGWDFRRIRYFWNANLTMGFGWFAIWCEKCLTLYHLLVGRQTFKSSCCTYQ